MDREINYGGQFSAIEPLQEFGRTLVREARRTYRKVAWRRNRRFGQLDRGLIESYLAAPAPHKLHIGAGDNLLDGWLNTNYLSRSPRAIHLDATQRFPFPDQSFDYLFSEHMIEHISYPEGRFMLRECSRILRPGGRIRISTPDFQYLLDLYQQEHSPVQLAYTEWMTEYMQRREAAAAPFASAIYVINNNVRDWGHQFIYDEASLRHALEQSGFQDVVRCALNESPDPALANLEHEERVPEGFVRLETLTVEGVR